MTDTAKYAQWFAAAKGAPIDPQDDQNICGFWRLDSAKTKHDDPVAIWLGDNGQVLRRGKQDPVDEGSKSWHAFIQWAWPHALYVTRDEYYEALKAGRWADNKSSRQMDEAEKLGIDVSTGGNNPPIEESLADQIKSLADVLDKTPEPPDQDAANKLSGNLEKMRGLLKLAEAERVKLKEPYLAAGREVDATWAGIKAPGEQAGINAEARRKAFLKKLQAKLDAEAAAERQRLQAIADAENERIRAENQKRIDEAQDHGGFDPSDPTDTPPELIPEVAAPVVETPRAVAGAAYGRASGLKKTMVAYVENPEALAMHFIKSNDPDFADYLLGRAKSALRGKVVLPGCGAREELK